MKINEIEQINQIRQITENEAFVCVQCKKELPKKMFIKYYQGTPLICIWNNCHNCRANFVKRKRNLKK